MDAQRKARRGDDPVGEHESVLPDLADLCKIYDVGLELIERSHDIDDLLDRVLDEYQRRLGDLASEALDPEGGPPNPASAKKLRGLVMFASQAVALKARASAAAELKRKADDLAEVNARLRQALADADTASGRLDLIVSTLDAGILVVTPDRLVLRANRAASAMLGSPEGSVEGGPVPAILAGVPEEGDLELRFADDHGEPDARVVLVSRRRVDAAGGDEVFLLSDVTSRTRDLEERHRLEKLAEVLRTLSVLSHKINNPLTALVGRSQLLKAKAGADPEAVKAAGVIEEAAMRIAELIRELALVVKEGRKEALDKMLEAPERGIPPPGGPRV